MKRSAKRVWLWLSAVAGAAVSSQPEGDTADRQINALERRVSPLRAQHYFLRSTFLSAQPFLSA